MKNTILKGVYTALVLLPMTAFGSTAKAGVTEKTLIDTYLEGGWVMHLLLLFSIGMVWLIIDIWMRTSRKKMTPQEDVTMAQDLFRAGDYVGAYQAMKASFSPFAEVMRAGLGSIGYGKDATEEAVYSTVEKVNSTLQTRINYLSVIGVCAPMIGLLGTVGGTQARQSVADRRFQRRALILGHDIDEEVRGAFVHRNRMSGDLLQARGKACDPRPVGGLLFG